MPSAYGPFVTLLFSLSAPLASWDAQASVARAPHETVRAQDEEQPANAVNAPPAEAAAPLRLKKLEVFDQGIGCNAFTMLVPADWKVEGGVVWQLEYSNLATGKMVVRDPKSAAALEVFPAIPYAWNDSGSYGFISAGQNYMGNVVAPVPRDVAQYVREVFVPRFRPRARVGEAKSLPDVARQVERNVAEAGVQKQAKSARVRLEYEERGRAIAEDVYVTIVAATSPMVPGSTMWSLEQHYSFRAEKERIDALAPLLQAMVASIQIDLRWYAGYAQVFQMWQEGQMQSIRAAGELSRKISANNDAMIASMRSAWEARQASQDRVSQEFSEYVRGVETYTNTFEERPVELPSGYNDVWVNSSGEYLLSNTAGYDPNVGSTLEWRRLEPAR